MSFTLPKQLADESCMTELSTALIAPLDSEDIVDEGVEDAAFFDFLLVGGLPRFLGCEEGTELPVPESSCSETVVLDRVTVERRVERNTRPLLIFKIECGPCSNYGDVGSIRDGWELGEALRCKSSHKRALSRYVTLSIGVRSVFLLRF